jgi:hypothetical protein
MCDYAHSGNLQLGRRFTGNELKPSYRDGDIIEVVDVPNCFDTAGTSISYIHRVPSRFGDD